MGKLHWKIVRWFLKKLNIKLPYSLTILLLVYTPKKSRYIFTQKLV